MSLLLYQQQLKNQGLPCFTQDRGCSDLHFLIHLSFSPLQTVNKFSSNVSLKVAYKFRLQDDVLPLVFMTKSFWHLLYMWSDLKELLCWFFFLLLPMNFFCKGPNHPNPHCIPLEGGHQLLATAITCGSLDGNLILVQHPECSPTPFKWERLHFNTIQVHTMVWEDDSMGLGLSELTWIASQDRNS